MDADPICYSLPDDALRAASGKAGRQREVVSARLEGHDSLMHMAVLSGKTWAKRVLYAHAERSRIAPFHIMDTLSALSVALLAGASNILLAMEASTNEVTDLRILLIPFMGAVVVSFACILLNPQKETRSITVGRALIALFVATSMPSAIGVFFESTKWMMDSPKILLPAGGILAFFAYILSRPFFTRAYERADAIARHELRQLERRIGMEQGHGPDEP